MISIKRHDGNYGTFSTIHKYVLILFQTNECEYFVDGGCGSNGNIFRTEDECSKACMDNSKEYDTSEEDTSE